MLRTSPPVQLEGPNLGPLVDRVYAETQLTGVSRDLLMRFAQEVAQCTRSACTQDLSGVYSVDLPW